MRSTIALGLAILLALAPCMVAGQAIEVPLAPPGYQPPTKADWQAAGLDPIEYDIAVRYEVTLEEWKKNAEDPSTLDGLRITLATKTFDDGYEIVDGDVKVIVKRTGGHTEGSSYVYCPNYKVMFAGDNLFNKQFPWGGPPSANPLKWIDALKKYLSLDVEHYIPGHGEISDEKPLEEFLNYLEKVTSLMKELISLNKTEEEILELAEKIDYYPPREGREQWKTATLRKWYEVISAD